LTNVLLGGVKPVKKAKGASEGMSIGALSRATGVPAATLRTWERRYGFPAPERTDSGHRRYGLRTLARLRLVARALELGHRPSTVLAADESALDRMVEALEPIGVRPPGEPAIARQPAPAEAASGAAADPRAQQRAIERWLDLVERFDGRAFERELSVSAAALGSLPFMEHALSPFLRELGERWAQGALGVRHEHFAAECVREFLAQRWRPLSEAAQGAIFVCATLPGERHVLGLHMVALALALHDARVLFLGADAPTPEIARAVRHHRAAAVVLSAAQGADRRALARDLATLRAGLPRRVPILAGGDGFPAQLTGAQRIGTTTELIAFLVALGRDP
jgi:DNA-binding transcriptional MerR regulator/methylmalonyl-CoA mutase cobalamin-binding subunit